MGKLSRTKGLSTEREIVRLHQKLGIKAERVPLSGAQRYQENGEDVDVYAFGTDTGPLVCQVKRRPETADKMLRGFLGDADALFLRHDAEPGRQAYPPLVVLPWSTWERLLQRR